MKRERSTSITSTNTNDKAFASVEKEAKVNALNQIETVLNRYKIDSASKDQFIKEISTAIKNEAEETTVSKPGPRSKSNVIDEHNEVCEVCDTGGDLLCCETCTLVYHISCLRPKINSIPKENWSCCNCIIDVSFYTRLYIACAFLAIILILAIILLLYTHAGPCSWR